MQLAHSGNQRLTRVVIGVHAERRIFLRQLSKRGAHFFLVGFGLGFDRYGNDGGGEIDVFEDDGLFFIAQRVAGRYVFQAHARGDVARFNRFDFLALVGVHAQQAAHALAHFSASSCKPTARSSARPE